MSYEPQPTPGWKRWRNRTVGPQRVHTPDPAVQPAFDFERAARPARKADLTIEQRFEDWLAANPTILHTLRNMALARAAAGETRISPKEIVEDLRRSGRTAITAAGEEYRINNIFTSRIGRILNDDPRLAGKIELRALKAA